MHLIKKLSRKVFPKSIIKLIERIFRGLRGVFWLAVYGFPARRLRVIAVTGTNGKTTTACFINEALKACGLKTALYTTALIEINGKKAPNQTHFTLISQKVVQQFLKRARKAYVDFVILEVTSHAIDQNRILGVPIEVSVMTNLTQDHLDYHGTMAEYARVKSLLFSKYKPKLSVLNIDDEWYGFFKEQARGQVLTYGKSKGASILLEKNNPSQNGSVAKISYLDKKYELTTNIPGEFNVYNALAALLVGVGLNQDLNKLALGIRNLKYVPGRMEEVKEGQNFRVYVDFAYTPDALEKVLSSVKKTTNGKVRIVFGATGDRDKSKRPKMGETVAKLADSIYLTDDETYLEDPEGIRREVMSGIKKAGGSKKTKEIADRQDAIELAIRESKKGDVLLISGLGHETERNMGGKMVKWDDRQIVKKTLQKASLTNN